MKIISLYGPTNTTSVCLLRPIVFIKLFSDALPSSSCFVSHLSLNTFSYLSFPSPSNLSSLQSWISTLSPLSLSRPSIYVYFYLSIFLHTQSSVICLPIDPNPSCSLHHYQLPHNPLPQSSDRVLPVVGARCPALKRLADDIVSACGIGRIKNRRIFGNI